jgi:hypothetical protein
MKNKYCGFLLVSLLIVGCGGGSGGSSSQQQNNPTSTVTSVTVSPSTATVSAGSGLQQFQATVTGTGNFNSAVTWSATGGSVDSTGLFTAGSTLGPATVIATAQGDSSVKGSAAVTVTAASVPLLGWYGTLTPSDNSTPLPLDFNLIQTGAQIQNLGPVLSTNDPQIPDQRCTNFNAYTATPPFIWVGPGNFAVPNVAGFTLTGSISGQSVTLTLNGPSGSTPGVGVQMSLVGTLNGSTMTGTFTSNDLSGSCFDVLTGTFNFTQYPVFSGTYQGNFDNTQVTIISGPVGNNSNLIQHGDMYYSSLNSPPQFPPSGIYPMLTEVIGRFFFVWTSYTGSEVGSTNLVAWGWLNTQQPSQLIGNVGIFVFGLPGPFDPTTSIPGTFTKTQ